MDLNRTKLLAVFALPGYIFKLKGVVMNKSFEVKIMLLNITFFVVFSADMVVAQPAFWEQTNGPVGQWVQALAVNLGGDIFSGTAGGGVFRSTDNGNVWTEINNGLTNTTVRALTINLGGDIFAGTDGGGVFRSTDNGENWVEVNNGITNSRVLGMATNSSGDIFVAAIFGGMFRSTDNGENWVMINQGLTDIQAITIGINSKGDIFVGTWNGRLFRSMNNGDTWQEKIFSTSSFNNVFSIAISPNGNIFLGTFRGIFRSTDNGDNWIPISTAVADVKALTIGSDGIIFAGTNGRGAFRSPDNGDTWLDINQGLSGSFVDDFTINSSGIIFAGTNQGVFRSVGVVTSIDESSLEVPTSFTLDQNYPNPFNPNTTIAYELPKSEYVTIKIYNVLGEEIKTLFNNFQVSGNHTITWDGTNSNNNEVSSGIYIYVIRAAQFSMAKKMILLR